MSHDGLVDDSAARHRRGPARQRSRRRTRTRIGVVVLAAVVLVTAGAVRFGADVQRAVQTVAADEPRAVSDRTVLTNLERVYLEAHLEPGTNRTLDPENGGITTSEGQSYTMLRSVWSDDLPTFTASWQWAKDNLQREDHLLSWRFGPRSDGTYGVQDELGGNNTASDADVDVAFALLMAYSRWKQDVFLYDAQAIIASIWRKEVVQVAGAPVLVANDLERLNFQDVLVNPSYFAPYAYRVFAKVDPTHDWMGVVDSSYAVLEQLDQLPLDARTSAGLPPDWVHVDRVTGTYRAVSGTLTTDFGYEALRSPWRLALDARWNGEERALRLLDRQQTLADQWTSTGRLAAVYHRDGTPAADYESAAMYGGAMGYFAVVRPDLAEQVYTQELLSVFDADSGKLARTLGYYDSNWVWLGMAFYLDQLPDLTVTNE